MIRLTEMVLTFLAVLVGSVVFAAVGIGLWIIYGLVGLTALAVVGTAIALAWAAAARVGDAARQAEQQVQRRAARQKYRREPQLAVPRQSRYWHGGADTSDDAIIVGCTIVPMPTNPEPRLFREADDFRVIEWTEDRRR